MNGMTEHGAPRRPPGRAAVVRAVVLALGVVAFLFIAYEVVERVWLRGQETELLYQLHRARGLISSVVAALLVAWLILRHSPPLLTALSESDVSPLAVRPDQAERLTHFAQWFITMRWIAVLAATAAVIFAVRVAELLPPETWWPLVATVAALAGLNAAYLLLLRQGHARRSLLLAQVYLDLGVLTILLHFSGGAGNPLAVLMLFHVIIAGTVLERRQCFAVAGTGSALVALLAWAEWSGALPHYPLGIFPRAGPDIAVLPVALEPSYAGTRVALQALILFGTAYFTTGLTDRIREDERQQKAVQARLIQTEKLAAIGQLAGQIAHEVNNPIGIISGKSRLLLADHRDEFSERTAQELAKITELADRVARIAQGLLSYSRPSPATRASLDLRVPIRKALAMVEPTALAAGIRTADRLPPTMPPMRGNTDELVQVFLNLFLNALDAMPHGGELTISVRADAGAPGPEPPFLAIQVADTGTGIPDEILEHVFEPFLTTKPDGRGTGLGLSICQGLVRSHGGRIDINSPPGRGTQVVVRLPVEHPAQPSIG